MKMKKNIVFICFLVLILSHCSSGSGVVIGPVLFEKYYRYITENKISLLYFTGIEQVLNERGDLDIPEFTPYMIDDTLFVLDTNPHYGGELYNSDVEDNDLAATSLRLFIFTKNKNEYLSYKIKKMVLHTSGYVKDVEELGFKWRDRSYAKETDSLLPISNNDEYRLATLVGGYVKYPRPKDMKMSICLEVEINKDQNISTRNFVYYYNLKLIKGWLRFLI